MGTAGLEGAGPAVGTAGLEGAGPEGLVAGREVGLGERLALVEAGPVLGPVQDTDGRHGCDTDGEENCHALIIGACAPLLHT